MASTEKDLDQALENAFRENTTFVEWFLGNTKFDPKSKRVWSRSDHPWGGIPVPDGEGGTEIVESETDVLVVFENPSGSRFALHIENKLANGKFEPRQPELYKFRAQHWLGRRKYQSYTDFQTVLVAPSEFRNRNVGSSKEFDCYVSHEHIAAYIPVFGAGRT